MSDTFRFERLRRELAEHARACPKCIAVQRKALRCPMGAAIAAEAFRALGNEEVAKVAEEHVAP